MNWDEHPTDRIERLCARISARESIRRATIRATPRPREWHRIGRPWKLGHIVRCGQCGWLIASGEIVRRYATKGMSFGKIVHELPCIAEGKKVRR